MPLYKFSKITNNSTLIFLVYDGHGGSKVASHVSRHLHKYIVRRPEYKDGNYEQAIIKGFLECDEAMKTDESLKDEMSGSTAITMLYRYEIINMYFDSLRQKFFFHNFKTIAFLITYLFILYTITTLKQE